MDHTEHRLSSCLSSPIDTPMNAKSKHVPMFPSVVLSSVIWDMLAWPYLHPSISTFFYPLSGSAIKTGKSLYNTNFFVFFPVMTVEEVPLGHWDIYQCLFLFSWVGGGLCFHDKVTVMMSISLPSYLPKSRNHLQLLYSHEWKAKWSPQTPAPTSLSHWVTANRNFVLLVLSQSEQNKLSFKQPP